jgi:hypothetical protein
MFAETSSPIEFKRCKTHRRLRIDWSKTVFVTRITVGSLLEQGLRSFVGSRFGMQREAVSILRDLEHP